MKRRFELTPEIGVSIFALWGIFLIVLFTGCKHLEGPPKTWEQKYFDITTNTIEMVNWSTNAVTITNYQDVIVEKVIHGTNTVTVTNVIPVLSYQTNLVLETNVVESYTFKPNERAQTDIVDKAGQVGGYAGPLGGTVAGGVASIGLALWGLIRSRKNKKTSEILAHSVQVARESLKHIPGAEAKYKDFLIKYQAETNTFKDVAKVLTKIPDSSKAKEAANEIVKPTT